MIHSPLTDQDRRRRADDEDNDWCFKRRRTIPKRKESEIHLELLISRIGEKGSSSMESNLESLAHSLEIYLSTDIDRVIDIIIECICYLPEEITAYSTLAGLLNSRKQKFGFELLHQLLEVLQEKLLSANFIHALHIVIFVADLINCHVVSSNSLVEFYESFMEAACEENVPQVRSDWFVYAVLYSLPWAGPELNDREKEPLDNLLEGIGKYMLERNTSHAKIEEGGGIMLLQVWSAMEHEQEEYLSRLWIQISKLRDDGWIERHISRYYIAFDCSLAGAIRSTTAYISDGISVTYCCIPFFDYDDCPDGGPVLPGAHSIERFLCSTACQLSKKAMVPINYMILEAIFSQLFRLPHPPLRPLFYGSLMIELCKMKDMPQVIAQAAELFYQRIDTMQLECIDRLIDWFSYHISNFEYRWSWIDWDNCLDLNDYAPRRYFVKEVIEKCMRFSYHERICDCLPRSFEEIAPEKPSILFLAEREEQSVKELVVEVERAFRNKAEPKKLTEILRGFSQKDNVMLNTAQKSFSHNFAALARYYETLKELSDINDDSSTALLRTLYNVWKHNRQMMVVLITKMLRMTLVSANAVASWLLSNYLDQELHRFWLWEALFVVIKYACGHTDRCKNQLQRMQEKHARMSRTDGDFGVVLDDDIEEKKKELVELQEMLKNLFLNVLHKLVVFLSEHLVKYETAGRNYDTYWYRYMMGRFKEILLRYWHELFEIKHDIDKELFVTPGIDPRILEIYCQFTALWA
ncbi:hypothetical protein DINM_003398 [Dirofilaria immitis]|nr:hypothetical protein [Dirofilaria immitis]